MDKTTKPPTKDQVCGWVKKDLQSAHYLLGLVLTKYPEIVREVGETVYETVMRKEQGAAIDHVKQTVEADQDGL